MNQNSLGKRIEVLCGECSRDVAGRSGLHLYFVALMDRRGERFREICYPALPKIFFHLPDLNSERFIAENVSNPARKIAATRMTFQGCGR